MNAEERGEKRGLVAPPNPIEPLRHSALFRVTPRPTINVMRWSV